MKQRKINNWKVITGTILIVLSPLIVFLVERFASKTCYQWTGRGWEIDPGWCKYVFVEGLTDSSFGGMIGHVWFIGLMAAALTIVVGFLLILAGQPRMKK
ncbi:hypothetical protein KI440_01135 [Candidatus Saccharibacteria bacterium TM7i]|nr:hypothetical protein KI440_01135 [Candidatus Saccharibacteria bacterium TM7i]